MQLPGIAGSFIGVNGYIIRSDPGISLAVLSDIN